VRQGRVGGVGCTACAPELTLPAEEHFLPRASLSLPRAHSCEQLRANFPPSPFPPFPMRSAEYSRGGASLTSAWGRASSVGALGGKSRADSSARANTSRASAPPAPSTLQGVPCGALRGWGKAPADASTRNSRASPPGASQARTTARTCVSRAGGRVLLKRAGRASHSAGRSSGGSGGSGGNVNVHKAA
jgi:hypothetical protein